MKDRDKQLKYSIRKFSVGVASVAIGAVYLAMGTHVAHAGEITPNSEQHDRVTGTGIPDSNPSETGTKTVTRTIKYVDASDESKEVSTTVTQTVTLTRKQGTEEWTTGKWEAKTAPTVDGYDVSGNNTVEAKDVTSSTESETVLVYYSKKGSAPSNSATTPNRGRRSKRDTGDAPTGETSGNSTGTETPAGSSIGNNEALDSAVTERKGSTVQPDQPGISIPKGEEHGAHDPNAHLKFDDPKEDATVEEMWKIIQHMPDDFQNNERSYLRNMDTLGNELRFDKTPENPEGVPLKPGEIRELHDFGGWHAIDKDGTQGKFVIGRKNEQGYFTGWHKVGQTENGIPIIEQGGMLGADALDNIYVHEQALDRRFNYMLMLVKGRTRANRDETVVDKTKYDPRAQNERAEATGADYNKLPFLEKDKINKYSPGVVGYNGIEKEFTAFSTKYGSRVRVDFVTGYITDINGSKGSYRVIIKAKNSKNEETTVYDETISRVAEIVQNEKLYEKGLNVQQAHATILKFFRDEFNYRVNKIKNPKVKAFLGTKREIEYTPEEKKVYDQILEEAREEVKKQGDIVMNVTEDFLSYKNSIKTGSGWKQTFTNTGQSIAKLSNDLNTLLKDADKDTPNTPTWLLSAHANAKADNRAYKLLTTLIPGAKKITYHVNDDQLEVETNKYTYTAARDGSKEVAIQGSDIAATLSANEYNANPETFDRENTNTKANERNNGWAKAGSDEFKHFSKFIGVDKGIVRTNEMPDETLSNKIMEAVGPGYSKLGKAGYFSTADIPLGTDIVSYTVQVIPSDNERVGVNPQSSRIQYNMPILADFSVIQDTTEPSKEVAKRILTKLKEQGKITGDQEKKIKEEIDKAKKTSELRSAMSGDVIVRYVDTDGNNLPITDADAKKAGEKTDNGYLVRKDVLIGTDYDVNSKKVSSFKATNGKYYALRSVGGGLETSSDAPSGSITKKNTVITFVYEERTTPPTGKGVVHFKKQVSETVTEPLTGYGDITLEGNVGETFSPTDVDTRITALKNAGYEIVTNEFDTNSKTIDSTTDEDGQDPSQVYNVIVREKVETVTTPPTPDTPVDPNIPEGPKWPESGLKESDLTKEVTRTITYVKKETADGQKIPDAQPTKVDKVLYKRTAKYNLVSKTVTYSNWTATADDTHTATSFSPVKTPVLTGYVADFKEVTDAPAAPTANGEVTNMTKEVVYTKIGSWVPKIPGKTPTPILYPNDPEDATKPKYPDYPTTPENPGETPNPQPDNPGGSTPGGGNETPGGETPGGGNETPGGETPGTPEKPKTPELPVIPYEPGYTPGIPTDPTQPVDPNTNPLVPLKPVDPKDPKKGYKVPEIPEKPGKDTPITYVADPQKALVKVVKVEGEGENKTETPLTDDYVNINGKTGEEIPDDSVTDKIADLEKRGYIVDNKQDVLTAIAKDPFDKAKDTDGEDPTQTFTLKVHEKVVEVTEPPTPNTPVDPNVPVEPNKPVDPTVPKWPAEGLKESDLKKEVTRTITYVKKETPNGEEVASGKDPVTQTAHFTRKASYNVVTETITYGNWESTDKELPKVDTPELTGYVADKASVDKVETNADSTGLDQKVVYTKLGSWVPNLPEGVKPPEGTDMTPKPYPNNPTDPTKPGDPTDPNTPNVPVIPYVPGYTPGIPTDPTKPVDPNTNPLVPLTPVDPEHPENGYKVPPVPTTPGENTPITYEANPQKALVKVVKVDGTTETPLTNDYVNINGKTGDQIPTESVTAKIAELEKRGYVIDNRDEVVNYINNKFDKNKDTEGQDPTQTVTLKVHEKVVEVTEPPTPNTPVDPNVPVEPNKPVDPTIPKWPAEGLKESDLKKEVTRTITYVKKETPNGEEVASGKEPVTQTAHFTRKASYNVVTGTITYGNWESTDKELPKVDTPELTGYVADKASVDKVETNADSTGLDQKVVYTKLGSWVPRLPEGVTPPTGTDMTPKPYPNNPTDPTKPGTPVYPEPGTPTDPNTPKPPVIPYVPGYTPKTPDGNPLVPVDPEHPENGYKVPPVPETPGKDTPITYEKVPNTPTPEQPETTGRKEVTRTIKYVDEKGNELAKPSTDKVTFTGNGSDWKAVGGDSTFDAVKSPVVKGYILKDPAQKVVEKETVKSDAKDETITVTYTKVGSFVPKVPEGVTPKTPLTPTPYDNDPEDPTKVVTPNPEKPQDPKDPNSPKVPVIPQVPGHTPVVPKDPTKPVSPENPLVPLTPVDPNHPDKGYNVPPVPTIPGQDTPITYVKDGQQKATTSFVDPKGNVLETPITETGDSNTPLTKNGEVEATIAKLKLKGYDVETNTYPPKGTFDNDPKVDQYFKVTLTPRVKPVKPFDPTNPKDPNKPVPGQPIDPDTPVDPNNPNDPTIPRWTDELIKKLDVKKEVIRTINYVDEKGNKVFEPSTDKVTFTREAKINVVTGEITYGDWKVVGGDSTFDKVSSPVVKGYILKDPAQKEVAERKGITPTDVNQTIEVVYKKLGSWVPKVPGVETPTPLPYPNNPTDPTKPGTPVYPEQGQPITPGTPVIPYVPGYTPKIGDKPLEPVDPNHPENGYKVPPVPEKPGEDTPITYEKVPNTPDPEQPGEETPEKPTPGTPESNHITIWVDENGKPLKPEKPGTHEPGNIPGYRLITTETKDGVTIHKFEKIPTEVPNNPTPEVPNRPTPTPEEQETPVTTYTATELPKTGTASLSGIFTAEVATILAGLGILIPGVKKKETEE